MSQAFQDEKWPGETTSSWKEKKRFCLVHVQMQLRLASDLCQTVVIEFSNLFSLDYVCSWQTCMTGKKRSPNSVSCSHGTIPVPFKESNILRLKTLRKKEKKTF